MNTDNPKALSVRDPDNSYIFEFWFYPIINLIGNISLVSHVAFDFMHDSLSSYTLYPNP